MYSITMERQDIAYIQSMVKLHQEDGIKEYDCSLQIFCLFIYIKAKF